MDTFENSGLISSALGHVISRRCPMIAQGANDDVILLAIRAHDADNILARVRHMLPEGSLLYARRETAGAPHFDTSRALSALTGRQRDVLRLLMCDLSNKEIGRRLALSHFTVRNHVSQLLRLLNVPSRKAAVALLNDAFASNAHVLPLSD